MKYEMHNSNKTLQNIFLKIRPHKIYLKIIQNPMKR